MTTIRPLATMLTVDSHPRLFTIGKHVASAVGGVLTYVFEEEQRHKRVYMAFRR